MPTATDATDLCGCGQSVEAQYQRHATQAEYDALPDGLKPIDGYAVKTVECCWDCHPGSICQHPGDAPVPCPRCKAAPGDPCVKPDGSPRLGDHRERAAAQPQPETCRHAHRETCTDPRDCHCSGDDQPPARTPRVILPPTAQEQAATLGFPPERLHDAAHLLATHGIDPARVLRGSLRTGLTQDNRPAILFDYATGQDEHGREVVETRVIPVE